MLFSWTRAAQYVAQRSLPLAWAPILSLDSRNTPWGTGSEAQGTFPCRLPQCPCPLASRPSGMCGQGPPPHTQAGICLLPAAPRTALDGKHGKFLTGRTLMASVLVGKMLMDASSS